MSRETNWSLRSPHNLSQAIPPSIDDGFSGILDNPSEHLLISVKMYVLCVFIELNPLSLSWGEIAILYK